MIMRIVDERMYRLHVTLQDTEPPVWRRLQVRGNLTFGKLHQILQAAMGWQDCHLHQFLLGDTCIGVPDPDDDYREHEVINETRVRLHEKLLHENMQLIYEYDFGDGWEHIVRVEKILPLDPSQGAAVCLDGAMACPPEDCGGTSGYYDKLKIVQDPTHSEYEDVTTWMPVNFDPRAFFLQAVNARLRRIK